MSRILKFWPAIALFLLNLLLFFTNWQPGTFLTGWDNLHPEFAPLLNVERSIFAVWQEYQSLGLLGGMGHASDLVRQVYVLLLSFMFPMNLNRYIATFTMLFIGSTGTFYLTHYILNKNSNDPNHKSSIINHKSFSFIASLFYLLNIATIQSFYAPFEAFASHFAALPWLILSSLVYLTNQSRRNLVFLIIVLALSTPSAYIPTLFVVFMLAISILTFVNFILSSSKKAFLIKALKLYLIIAVVNAFWLLPFLYFTATNSHVNVESKINQMATSNIYEQNKEFGTLTDTALLRGFWFNNVDPNINGENAYMLEPWRNHFENPLVPNVGYALFAITLIGAFFALFKLKNSKSSIINRESFAFAVLFLFAFTMLATTAFPFSFFNEVFRKIPLFDQAFRFPFTKFNTLAALTYSIMIAYGLYAIYKFLDDRIWKVGNGSRKLKIEGKDFLNPLSSTVKTLPSIFYLLPSILVIAAILWIALPVFSGHLFYSKSTINIPQEYFDLFEYFKNQPPAARVANLPQPTFWGWSFYRWGGGGSGFMWYGIKQPILDRAFDVWSAESENYYYELSFALHRKDLTALENVLNKYQVSFILLDKNVFYPHSPQALFYNETEDLLGQAEFARLDATFGNITVYKVDLKDNPKSFVFSSGNLPEANLPFYKTRDVAYEKYGNYRVGDSERFPLSFFTLKKLKNNGLLVEKNETEISITTSIEASEDTKLTIPEYKEKIIAATFSKSLETSGDVRILATVKTPKIHLDGRRVWGGEKTIQLFRVSKNIVPFAINVNGTPDITVDSESENILGTTFLSRTVTNQIVVAGLNTLSQAQISNDDYEELFEQNQIDIPSGKHKLTLVVPKIEDSYLSFLATGPDAKLEDCNSFRSGPTRTLFAGGVADIVSTNASQCLSFFSETITHDLAYAIFVGAENQSGRPLRLWVLNEDEKTSPLDVYLDSKRKEHSFILPQMEENGDSYSFHFDNSAVGKAASKNILSYLEVFPIPQDFAENIALGKSSSTTDTNSNQTVTSVSHPNPSIYDVLIPKGKTTTLVLSQSYNPGWKAYYISSSNLLSTVVPFIFGKEVKEHFVVNSWENGWVIEAPENRNGSIMLVYLPQYLQYAGFFMLLILSPFVLKRRAKISS